MRFAEKTLIGSLKNCKDKIEKYKNIETYFYCFKFRHTSQYMVGHNKLIVQMLCATFVKRNQLAPFK